LADAATVDASNVQTRWGAAAWFDQRTFVDDNPAVDRAHLFTKPVFLVNGFLDGSTSPQAAIEAWQTMHSATGANNADAFLYLGACGNAPASCGSVNSGWLQLKVKAFLEKYTKGVSWTAGGPLFYLTPPKWVSTSNNPFTGTNADTWRTGGAPLETTTWPPTGNTVPSTSWLCGDSLMWSTACTGTTPKATKTIQNLNDNDTDSTNSNLTDATYAFCACLVSGTRGYFSSGTSSLNEVTSYTSDPVGAGGIDLRSTGFTLDLFASSDTSRLQVYADIYEVQGTTEIPLWQGMSQYLPTARHQKPGTKVHFVFQPAGVAWTITSGSKIRVKISSNQRGAFAAEQVPGTTTLYHDPTASTPMKFSFNILYPTV